jgi:amino acid transporter
VVLHEPINLFAALFIGWFVAGLLAELPTRRPTEQRRAMLTPRTVAQFLPGFPKRVLIAATFSTLLVLTAAINVHEWSSLRRDGHDLGVGVPIAALVVSVALAVVSVAGMRRLAHKPFPVTEQEINVAETAIRTAASVRIAAGWSALQFITTMWVCSSVARVAISPWSTLANLLALLAFFGIVVAWTFVPTRVLRRQSHAITAP